MQHRNWWFQVTLLLCLIDARICFAAPVDTPLVRDAKPGVVEALDEYLAAARRTWGVPGMAVAIVKDDQVILAKGYGTRAVNRPDPVDADTLFAIASNTKAFTAAAVAQLVEQGKLSWDDPVRRHLPWFQLYDPMASAEIRVRDLFCHRSGLGTFSGDLLWYQTRYTPEEVLRRTRHLEPTGRFRADYGYSNLMYLAAGEVIATVSGTPWQDYVQQQILDPLEMNRTVTSVRDLIDVGNFATPHKTLPEESRPIVWVNWDTMAAAGGIISSVRDMTKWMRVQLRQGKIDESRRLFTAASSREMWTPHISHRVSEDDEQRFPTTHFRAYGLGWGLSDYRGRKIAAHGGGYDDMYSRLTLVPEERLGIVVLTNSMTSISSALTYRILDAYLGGGLKDWSKEGLRRFRAGREKFYDKIQSAIQPVAEGTSPTLGLDAYAGTYTGKLYGNAVVEVVDEKLVLRLLPSSKLIADLEHLHYNTFVIRWRHEFAWFDEGTAHFVLDARARVQEMKLNVPNDDLWFHELEFRKQQREN